MIIYCILVIKNVVRITIRSENYGLFHTCNQLFLFICLTKSCLCAIRQYNLLVVAVCISTQNLIGYFLEYKLLFADVGKFLQRKCVKQ